MDSYLDNPVQCGVLFIGLRLLGGTVLEKEGKSIFPEAFLQRKTSDAGCRENGFFVMTWQSRPDLWGIGFRGTFDREKISFFFSKSQSPRLLLSVWDRHLLYHGDACGNAMPYLSGIYKECSIYLSWNDA